MRAVWSRLERWIVLSLFACLLGCSNTSIPTPKSDPQPLQLKLTRAEFFERFAKLPIPAPVSRIEYLFGAPHDKELTEGQKAPALYLYHCRDGEAWISFGASEGTYGALTCHEGTPSDADRTAARDAAFRGAQEAQERALRHGLDQKERRLTFVQERLSENRDRILALREEQAAFAEKQWLLCQENIKRYREAERQRLVKACPPLTPAEQIDQELKHRNIRLQTLFRDELQALNSSLIERQRDVDDKVRVMRQSMDRSVKELAQLNAELKDLRSQLGSSATSAPAQEPPANPDESPALERCRAISRKLQDIQAPVLNADDAKAETTGK